MFNKSSNPALSKNTFSKVSAEEGEGVMTISSTINKIAILFLLVIAAASYTWSMFFNSFNIEEGASKVMPWMIGGAIGGFILALIIIFSKKNAKYLVPLYALVEGLFLGAISAFFEARFSGIVIQAVGLTFGTMLIILFLYKSKIIKVTEKFRMGVVAATGAIALMYFFTFILNMFGVHIGYIHSGGFLGIGISLFIVVIAALNLVLDFDFIQKGAESGAPKYMEWYASFGLLVTLVWLYLEILRLLSMLSRD